MPDVGRGVALLVIDVQEGAVARGPHRVDEVIDGIRALADTARRSGVEVIYVQHDGAVGDAEEPFTPGWQICSRVAPHPGERVVRKRSNSAFRNTGLHDALVAAGIGRLIVTGIQTEYCVDTTVRVAFELGYDVVVPRDATTTFDNGPIPAPEVIALVHDRILDGRFAEVTTLEAAFREIERAGQP